MDELIKEPESPYVCQKDMDNCVNNACEVLRMEYLGLIGDVKELLDNVNGENI